MPPFALPTTSAEAVRMLWQDAVVTLPRVGRAPLEVQMCWGRVPVTYTRPGTYAAITRITDRAGRVTTYASAVEVMSATAFDAEMSGRWATFKAALRRGSIDQALECVLFERRDDARRVLLPGSRYVAGFLRYADTLTFLQKTRVDELEYRTNVVDGRALPLVFWPDLDGVWRIWPGGWSP